MPNSQLNMQDIVMNETDLTCVFVKFILMRNKAILMRNFLANVCTVERNPKSDGLTRASSTSNVCGPPDQQYSLTVLVAGLKWTHPFVHHPLSSLVHVRNFPEAL